LKNCCELELDGGIDISTVPIGVAAGADVLVAGSAIFNHPDGVAVGMEHLRLAIAEAQTS
jgi:ribulose-phosphate 3-epimerase